MYTGAVKAGAPTTDMYNVAGCPNVDSSSLPVSVALFKAFGAANVAPKNATAPMPVPGTSHNFTLYTDLETAVAATATAADAATETSAGARGRAALPWAALGAAAALAGWML